MGYSTILDIYKDAFDIFDDGYFHVGGDEVKDTCWGSNTSKLYTSWISQMCNNVNGIGHRTPILWSGDVDVNAQIGQDSFDIVMQIWDNAQDKLAALKNGFKVIDSTYTSYYLDCGFGNWLGGGNSWCDPYKTWLNIYDHSLTDGIPAEYLNGIMGGEFCLWGESVDDNNLQPRLWPRAAAAAERWWTDTAPNGADSLNELFFRIAMQRDWMVHQGIIASPVQPRFCTLYPSYCDYYRNGKMSQSKKWKSKLAEYGLDQFASVFEEHGWDMMEYWKELSRDTAEEMGFKHGHWKKFEHLLENLDLSHTNDESPSS